MAEIVFSMAVPHSGILGKDPDTWPEDRERDMSNKREMWYRMRPWKFLELAEHRKNDGFLGLIEPAERRLRFDKCQVALDKMRKALYEARIDVAIVLGKDQKEIFPNFSPSLCIYTGKEIYNGPPQRSVYAPNHDVVYQNQQNLALHLINSFQADGFDMMDLEEWLPNTWTGNKPIVPHAFGFIAHTMMRDNPPPMVPFLVNCFYKPTQPSMKRCIELGKSLAKAIKAWPENKRVGIIASGGLTHFIVDEAQDAVFLDLLGRGDLDGLAAIDERIYQSGTSEVKLYAPLILAMQDSGAPMTLVDYVPCYRSEAGTGEGMGFMYWASGK